MNPSARAPIAYPEFLAPRDPFASEDPRQLRFPFVEADPEETLCPTSRGDEPMPARMLNEFVYCPRLFYYEFVEGVFLENADTVRGETLHARVDKGRGDLPEAEKATTPAKRRARKRAADQAESTAEEPRSGEPETIHSRSVMLSSQALGVVAKMDLIEVRMVQSSDGQADLFQVDEVTPVDYKAGSPREGTEGAELWDTDRMQLGLQMLILRDNGYACREGVIYYRGTKQRVRLPLTPELEHWIQSKIAEARKTALSTTIPPPLQGSPKCVRCSLAPICLPDETKCLAAKSISPLADNGEPLRRLIASRDESRCLYLNTPGLRVGRKEQVLVVKQEDRVLEEVRASDVSQVGLFGPIQISTQTIQLLCEEDIPVAYFSTGGWFYGMTRGHGLKNVFTRIEQFRQARDPWVCLALARAFVHGKIRNQRTMLMRLHQECPAPVLAKLKRAAQDAEEAGSLASLLGIEGAAAALYFQQFSGMIKTTDEVDALSEHHSGEAALTFDFTKRSRRPPADPVNALLSLAYSLLAKDCAIAAASIGLDPYFGYFHQPRHGRPALALDLMGEFRPIIADSAVLTCINNRSIQPTHFLRAGRSTNLSPEGRKIFFHAYEQRMNTLVTHPVFHYKVTYRRVLELQARILAKALTGEVPRYIPMMTR